MAVYDLNFKGIAVFKAKADAQLVIDANAPRPFPIAVQRLQAVSRRRPEILDGSRVIQHVQLAFCHRGDVPEHGVSLTLKESLRFLAPKRFNHSRPYNTERQTPKDK